MKVIIFIKIIIIMQRQIPDDPTIVEDIFKTLKNNFNSRQTCKIEFRIRMLNLLLKGYKDMIPQFDQALKEDLGYNTFMANFLAHQITINQIQTHIKGVKQWVKPKKVQTPILLGLAKSEIQYQPLGIVLVLSAWNYPIYTAIPLVAAAIAAGNTVILKPSQMAPNCSKVLKQLFNKYMDPDYYVCVQGKVQVASAFTKLPFDKICFTGSSATGKLVAMQAAKNLTPCLLELGGKCPTIVDQTASLESAAMRILAGKFMNCGQTCVAVDHVFVHEKVKENFKKILIRKAQQFYGGNQYLMKDGNYGKIINSHHLKRLISYLDEPHGGRSIYGGQINHENLFIGPIIIDEPRKDSLIMVEQIFGPILPLISYSDIDELIILINSKPKPLAIYHFSESHKYIEKVRRNTFSGAYCLNDAVIFVLNTNLPFGGVGKSGYGRWSGKAGYEALSNLKSICYSKAVNMFPLSQRFPPYTNTKQSIMNSLLKIGSITNGQLGRGLILLLLFCGIFGTAYKYRARL